MKERNVGTYMLQSASVTIDDILNKIKGTIFGALYIIHKNASMPKWIFYIALIIDFIQVCCFSFTTTVNFPWHANYIIDQFLKFFNVFRLDVWIGAISVEIYIAFIYVVYFLLILIIADFVYAVVAYTKNWFPYVWPLKILRALFSLIINIFYLPLLSLFMSLLICTTDSDGVSVHYKYSSLKCWDGINILHSLLAILMSLLLTLLSVMVALCYFEPRMIPGIVDSRYSFILRMDGRGNVITLIYKVLLILIFDFLGEVSA